MKRSNKKQDTSKQNPIQRKVVYAGSQRRSIGTNALKEIDILLLASIQA